MPTICPKLRQNSCTCEAIVYQNLLIYWYHSYGRMVNCNPTFLKTKFVIFIKRWIYKKMNLVTRIILIAVKI